MEEIKKELTNEEQAIRKEAFFVGYGAALQETRETLSEIIDEIDEALRGIKEQLEADEDKKDETKEDENKGE